MMNRFGAIANLIFVYCLILKVRGSSSEECIAPEDIYPCYCEEDEGAPVIHCNHLTTSAQLNQAVRGLKELKTWKLSFWRSEIPVLRKDVFQGLEIQRLLFENSTFKMEAPQFVGLENSLSVLQITSSFNSTSPMEKWSLGHLLKLREIEIYKSRIPVLEDDWLTSVSSNLRTLNLEENGIEKLGSKVFSTIESLTFLFLENNLLTSLKRSMFPSPADNLRTININFNKIQSLPDDIFEGMPILRTVKLENNFLATIEESVWSSVMSQLSILDLQENPIRCDFSLKWMYEIGKMRPLQLSGQCESPKRLKGRSLTTLSRREIV